MDFERAFSANCDLIRFVLCLAFLNLESVGSNGKEILFQSGPKHGWLIDVSHKSIDIFGMNEISI